MEKSVGLVVYRDTPQQRLFLLLHYPGGHWDFPKGHTMKGESEHQTALRELREETQISDAQVVGGYRGEMTYFFHRNSRTVRKKVIYYVARTETADVILSPEHRGWVWLPANQALDQLTYENSRRVLREALDFLEQRRA